MIGSVIGVAVAVNSLSWFHDNRRKTSRPIATPAAYPAGMADDVHRPGFNGRQWSSRPVVGGTQGPYPTGCSSWSSQYGAFGNENATVYVRVGGQVIGINAFEPITKNGLRRLEEARNFWLRENGYTGGVRTFTNDAFAAPKTEAQVNPDPSREVVRVNGKIEPRASFQLPEDMPRRRNRLRVDAGNVNGAAAIVKFQEGTARVSWPMNAPAEAVARTDAQGGTIQLGAKSTTAVAAAK